MLTGDTIFVTPGEDRLTFVWSAPNRIPLPEAAVRRIVDSVGPYEFDRIYGGPMYGSGGGRPIIQSGAKEVVLRSAQRYIEHLGG